MFSPFTSSANRYQREAIETTDGPLLIIAGPGSGKTFTLVERVVYLITQKRVAPENLLVVTFTDKAAQELTTRISNRLTELDIRFNLNEMYLGTFHSICLRWLEEYREFTRLKRNFTMMDQFDQQYFLYQRMREYEAMPGIHYIWRRRRSQRLAPSEPLLQRINTVSEEALDIDVLVLCCPTRPCAPSARRLRSTNASLKRPTPSTSPPSSTRRCACCVPSRPCARRCAPRSPT